MINKVKEEIKKDSYIYKEFIEMEGLAIDVKASLFDDSYNDGNFLGTFLFKRLEFETENEIIFKGKEFTFFKAIKVENEWININVGKFIVDDVDPNDTKETVKVTGYDYGLKSANYYTSNLDYSSLNVTLQDVLNEITDKLGYARFNLDINGNFIVDGDQFSGTGAMYGDVIKEIAKVTANFAKINSTNNLIFTFKNETDIIIEDYVEVADKRDTSPFTSVSIGSSVVEGNNVILQDAELVAKYGENWYNIEDSPFAYSVEKKEQLIAPILEKIKGFGYSSFTAKDSFIPYANTGDLVKVKDKNGNISDSIILRITSNYDEITLEAPSLTKATVSYEKPVTPLTVSKRAEVIANQALNEVQIVAGEIEHLSAFEKGYQKVIIENSAETFLYRLKIYGNDTCKFIDNNTHFPFEIKDPILYINYGEYDHREYDLKIPSLKTYEGKQDYYEMVNGKATLHKFIQTDADGNVSLLENPKIIDLGEIQIQMLKGQNELWLPKFNYFLEIEYLIDNKYTDTFATQVNVENQIKVNGDGIIAEAKSYTDTLTEPTELVASLNLLPTGEAKLLATRTLDLEGTDINLTGQNVTISSNNFNVNTDGIVSMKGANIEDGNINISQGAGNQIRIYDELSGNLYSAEMWAGAYRLSLNGEIYTWLSSRTINNIISGEARLYGSYARLYLEDQDNNNKLICQNTNSRSEIIMHDSSGQMVVEIQGYARSGTGGSINLYGNQNEETISFRGGIGSIRCISLTETSIEENKKNFEKLENALEIIKSIDIYKYNFKTDNDVAKKHIGFVIGKDFKYSKELTNEDNTGVNAYGMASVNTKAIQELYDIIKLQQVEINELKRRMENV